MVRIPRLSSSLAFALALLPHSASAGEWTRSVFPVSHEVFAPLKADMRQVRTSVRQFHYAEFSLADVGLGKTWGLARWQNPDSPWVFQFDVEGMAFSRFRLARGVNEFQTVDFFINLPVSARKGKFSTQAMLFHTSSHLGDDYIRRTRDTGFRYSTEGFKWLLSYDLHERLRVYGGATALFRTIPSGQGGELQTGFELKSKPWRRSPLKEHEGWFYLAQDLQSKGRAAWNAASYTELGVRLGVPHVVRAMRFHAGYYTGKSEYGEFFTRDESYWAFGLSFDFS